MTIDGGGGEMSYPRSRSADGVAVIAEFSSDLSNWSPTQIVNTVAGANGIDTVRVAPLNPIGSRGFFRLRVEVIQ